MERFISGVLFTRGLIDEAIKQSGMFLVDDDIFLPGCKRTHWKKKGHKWATIDIELGVLEHMPREEQDEYVETVIEFLKHIDTVAHLIDALDVAIYDGNIEERSFTIDDGHVCEVVNVTLFIPYKHAKTYTAPFVNDYFSKVIQFSRSAIKADAIIANEQDLLEEKLARAARALVLIDILDDDVNALCDTELTSPFADIRARLAQLVQDTYWDPGWTGVHSYPFSHRRLEILKELGWDLSHLGWLRDLVGESEEQEEQQ